MRAAILWFPENSPRSGSGFGFRLALELGLGGNFPRTDIMITYVILIISD